MAGRHPQPVCTEITERDTPIYFLSACLVETYCGADNSTFMHMLSVTHPISVSFILFLSGCTRQVTLGDRWLPADEVPQSIRSFVEKSADQKSPRYSVESKDDEEFIEVTLPNAKQQTELLFRRSGELVEKSVTILMEDLTLAQQASYQAVIREKFPQASIHTVERVTRYQAGASVVSIDITISVSAHGAEYYELTFAADGTLQESRKVSVSAIDTLF